MNAQIVTVGGYKFKFYLTETAPTDPVELRGNRWYIKMGFAGFNTRANNGNGYATRAKALEGINRCQNNTGLQIS